MKLQQHDGNAAREEEVDCHHGKRYKLGWDINEHVVRSLSSLLLGYSICHGEEERLRQDGGAETGQMAENLKLGSASITSRG